MLAISDRIVTMREGRVTGEMRRAEASEEILMSMMTLERQGAHDGARRRTMTEATRAEPASGRRSTSFGFLARFAPLIFLLVLMARFAIIEPRFLSPINLFNVMRQVSITGLLAIGMTFVILTAGIDLSVGSLLAFAGLVAAAVAKGGLANRFTVGEGQDASAMAGTWRRSRRSPSASSAATCRALRSPG